MAEENLGIPVLEGWLRKKAVRLVLVLGIVDLGQCIDCLVALAKFDLLAVGIVVVGVRRLAGRNHQ